MEQFLIVVTAHFLALLSPGPDFFLIARTSLSAGWRTASGACLGIALANGVFIVAAFAGTAALRPDGFLFAILQLAGCVYLVYLGQLFIRHAGRGGLQLAATGRAALESAHGCRAWRRALGQGFLSGIFNPKNALFYTSLAALLTGPHASLLWKVFYGSWMFTVVLLWDLLMAILIGSPALLGRFARALPWLERISGVVLILLALGVVTAVLLHRGPV